MNYPKMDLGEKLEALRTAGGDLRDLKPSPHFGRKTLQGAAAVVGFAGMQLPVSQKVDAAMMLPGVPVEQYRALGKNLTMNLGGVLAHFQVHDPNQPDSLRKTSRGSATFAG